MRPDMLMQTVYDEPEERQDRTLVPVHVDMAGFDPVWVSVSTEEAWDALQVKETEGATPLEAP